MVIFKLECERPAYSLHENLLYYVKDFTLPRIDLTTSKVTELLQMRVSPRTIFYSISYNPARQSVLVVTRVANFNNTIYELYLVSFDADCPQEGIEGKRSNRATAIWIALDCFPDFDVPERIKVLRNCRQV